MMKFAIALGAAAAFAATAALAGDKGKDWDAKIESHFKEVDADANGQVTEAELVAYMTAKAKAEFAEMAGDDGVATLEEAKAHHKAKHDEMKAEHGDDKTE